MVKNQIFKKVYLALKPTGRSYFFFFFARTTQNQSRNTKYLAVEGRQSHLVSSNMVDSNIGKSAEMTGNIYRYKDKIPIPPLMMQDDTLGISVCVEHKN